MCKGKFTRNIFLITFLLMISILIPSSSAFASKFSAPPYPNLEPFSIQPGKSETYTSYQSGDLTPSYFFPELQNYKSTTLDNFGPLNSTGGNFRLSGTTGPSGSVTGSFTYSGYSEKQWQGEIDTYEVTVEGRISNAYAAFDDKGYLRVMGAAHYQRKFEYSGPVTITMKYSALVWDDDAEDYIRIGGTVTAHAQIAFLSCISDLEDTNLCHFGVGDGYGDYGLSAEFVNESFYDFVWFNNLDYEFGLISDINFDPEAHHKEQPPEEEDFILVDESNLDVPEKAEEITDNPAAGFTAIVSCGSQILPEDGINCNLNILHGSEAQPYTVNWIMDGYVLKSGTVFLGQDDFAFPNPPPGDHSIQVQVIDQATYDVRVSSTNVEILVPPDIGLIDPWAQAAAGAGSVLILGAWLWAEWASAKAQSGWFEKSQEKTDEALSRQRAKWYEDQMARNDEIRLKQTAQEQYQVACEKEWKRFRNELVKITDKYEKSDYLIDLYDDMGSDVHQDGKWDGKALTRLEELINTHLKMDRDAEAYAGWKQQIDSLNRRQKEFTDLTGSWAAMGVEVVSGILTGGASEVIFMPTRAIGNALYASRRARLMGKTGWEAAKSIMVESGIKLGTDYIFSKAGEKIVGKLVEYGGKGAQRVVGEEGLEAISEWWQRTSVKLGGAPKLDVDLPVIKQNWGRGPQVFVNKPIFKPGDMPPVDLGMDNYLNNHIRPLSSDLADDMGRLFREGVDIDVHVNNLLESGSRYTVSQTDEIAVSLMNNPAYKQAVREGVVPSSVQQVVYQARDKICKNAIQETFEKLDNVLLDGKPASSYIESVAVTGTGAKPLSPQAVGRFTDFDSTVIAGDSEIARKAEELFSKTFREAVEESGVRAGNADVNMFSGIHADNVAPPHGGYGSDPLIHWHKVDMINRGRSAVRWENGSIMFDAHPDVAPLRGFGPLEPVPHFPVQPEAAVADVNRVIGDHINDSVSQTGESLSRISILRQEGKHAMRVWKTINAGRGSQPPQWIKQLEILKRDPSIELSTREITSLWKNYSEYLDLPDNLGA